MYRHALGHLADWYEGRKRKPLILRGARQVGKSTLVRMFAESKNLILHEINLERHLYLSEVLASFDIELILDEIRGLTGSIDPKRSLIFLDEVQAVPAAIQSLRYFYEDRPDLAVISAGSLLEFALSDGAFSMPVGRVTYYHLGPLSFSEYLLARDSSAYEEFQNVDMDRGLPATLHRRFLKLQREYLFVGGMPEAVVSFLETGEMDGIGEVHRSILDTYMDDFSKYAQQRNLARMQKLFRSVPMNIGKKVKYSQLAGDEKAIDVRKDIDLLTKAQICFRVSHSDGNGLPLGAEKSEKVFKLLFVDCGLMNTMLALSWDDVRNIDDLKLVNEGSIAEQFVGQQLLYLGRGKTLPELYYWLREERTSNAEVDYLLGIRGQVVPVEVKAGSQGSLKSLHQFAARKEVTLAVRFDTNRPSLQEVGVKVAYIGNTVRDIDFRLLSLPLYLSERLADFAPA